MFSIGNAKFFLARKTISGIVEISRGLFIQPGDVVPTLTTQQLITNFQKLVGTSRFFQKRDIAAERKNLMELLPRDRSELPPRRMQDSFMTAVIPLKSDLALREWYVNAHGLGRYGRLFEDMDIFAGAICYKHIVNPRSEGKINPYSCVTILVDNMKVSTDNIVKSDEDIRLSGHVSFVGKSSMEVAVRLDQHNAQGSWETLTQSWFVFVARNSLNTGPALVNPLVAGSKEEEEYMKKGAERNAKRRQGQIESVYNKPPNPEESQIIHKLFTGAGGSDGIIVGNETLPAPPNSQYMSDWVLNSLLLCHPQYRNRFNKIFGGFIMRQAFEIAYSTVFQYAKAKCKIVYVDDILFRAPVEIGYLLKLTASVSYVEDMHIQIRVVAEVNDPTSNIRSVTTLFQFTFLSLGSSPPPIVLPKTYLEALHYLDARRHYLEMKSSSQVTTPLQ